MSKSTIKNNAMRRALIVGINHYKRGPLDGCVNDAKNMYKLLSRHEDKSVNFDCRLIISKDTDNPKTQVSTRRLKKQIYNLLYQEAEIAILYFSGHGNTNDIGSYLVTQDAEKYQEGVSLEEIITMANTSKVREVIMILDCCHSGHLGNLKELGGRKAILREGVSILTSSRDNQYSFETLDDQGLFTSILCEALKGGAADILGNINISGVYNYIDQLLNTWEQRPIFKSHASKMVSLRKTYPKIRLKSLRKLIKYFPTAKHKFPLDPSYERDLGSTNEKNIKKMKYLREFYMFGLLTPVNEKYLFEAARKSTSCKLSELGRYYWKMVTKNKI